MFTRRTDAESRDEYNRRREEGFGEDEENEKHGERPELLRNIGANKGRTRMPLLDSDYVWVGQMWDMQPDEPPKAFQYFSMYRDMGPSRSQSRVVALLGGKSSKKVQIGILASRMRWYDRALAYDKHLDQIRQETAIKTAQEEIAKVYRRYGDMLERHVVASQGLFASAVEKMLNENSKEKILPQTFKEVLMMFRTGVEIETSATEKILRAASGEKPVNERQVVKIEFGEGVENDEHGYAQLAKLLGAPIDTARLANAENESATSDSDFFDDGDLDIGQEGVSESLDPDAGD